MVVAKHYKSDLKRTKKTLCPISPTLSYFLITKSELTVPRNLGKFDVSGIMMKLRTTGDRMKDYVQRSL